MSTVPHTTTQEAPDLWRFNESMAGMPSQPYVDSYLLIGTKRAALIDALQSAQTVSLVEEVRQRTNLPVDVLITHGHPDHAGAEMEKLANAEGFTLYMSHLDLPIFASFSGGTVPAERFHDIQEGDEWDLGGITLKAYRVAGHTPGSFVFLDRDHRRAFTGDAFGLWLQLPHSLTMAEFCEEARRFEGVLADIPETTFYTGHLYQCGEKPWTAVQCTYLREVAEQILAGTYQGEEIKLPAGMENSPMAERMRGARIVKYKTVTNFIYRDDQLR